MRFFCSKVSSTALLVLVFNAQVSWVNAFTPSIVGGRASTNLGKNANTPVLGRQSHLLMAGGDDGYFMSSDNKNSYGFTAPGKVSSARIPKKEDETSEEEPSAEKMTQVRSIYGQWCEVYEKKVDEDRFKIFASNFLSMKAYANKTGKVMQFHKWYDCTEEEYIALTVGTSAEQIQATAKTEEEIIAAVNRNQINDKAQTIDAEKWASEQANFAAESKARLKKLTGTLSPCDMYI